MPNLLDLCSTYFRQRWLLKTTQSFTLVGPERIRSLSELAKTTEKDKIPGDFVECGVYNGGTAAVLAYFAARSTLTRTTWLFDSFEGMPQTTYEDGEAAVEYVGDVVGSIEKVNIVLQRVGAKMSKVHIVQGWFQNTFPNINIPKIALLNIDADWFESVRLCLETFYDAVVPGGYISIDDYGYWPGCKQAVDQFFSARHLEWELHTVDYTARWFQKI